MSAAESPPLPRIAVLGAGHSGPVIARVALDAGYPVSIAASGDPAEIELIAEVLMPGAKPRWAADAVAEADLVVLAIPLHKLTTFDPALVADRLVIDVMNYWPAVDGVQQMFEDASRGSSEIVQERLARSTVVKTLNHIGYHEIEDDRRPADPPGHRIAARWASPPTTRVPVTWSLSWWRTSATTRSGWTACAPVACSSQAGPSSGRR